MTTKPRRPAAPVPRAPAAGDDLALPPRRKIKAEVLGVRLDEHTARALDRVAAARGLGASTLARMWLLERLAAELPTEGPDAWVTPGA